MNKKNLLSIGELSKVTGVHIKSLRYYDSLGILTPAFVDPDSGYRYYSFYQTALVYAIQLCVELNIPLKQFSEYVNASAPTISYTNLIQQGQTILAKKIETMQKRLERLQVMQSEIERAEVSYHSMEPQKYMLPERNCWLVPYEGNQFCDRSNQLTKRVLMDIHRNGLQLGDSGGLLLQRQNSNWKQFLFVDVQASAEEIAKHPEIIHIPKGSYLCKKVEHSDIHQAWDWSLPFVKKEQIQLVIEIELFVGNYHFSAPALEQRCLLQNVQPVQ